MSDELEGVGVGDVDHFFNPANVDCPLQAYSSKKVDILSGDFSMSGNCKEQQYDSNLHDTYLISLAETLP